MVKNFEIVLSCVFESFIYLLKQSFSISDYKLAPITIQSQEDFLRKKSH